MVSVIDRIIIAIGKHIRAEEGLAGTTVGVGVYESGDSGVIISGLEVIEASLGWVLLYTWKDCPPRDLSFGRLLAEIKCYLPAGIAVVIPRQLSRTFLKPLE